MPSIDPASFAARFADSVVRDGPVADAKAADANRLAIKTTRPPKETRELADTDGVSNPSLYSIGTFQLTVTAFADGAIQFECSDIYGTVGGHATVRAADMPMTYKKFVKYGDQIEDRLALMCWVTDAADGRVKLAIGRGLTVDSDVFREVKWEVEFQPVSETELQRILLRNDAERVIRRALAKRRTRAPPSDADALISALRAMHTRGEAGPADA